MKKINKYLAVIISVLLFSQQVMAQDVELIEAGIEFAGETMGSLSNKIESIGEGLKDVDISGKIGESVSELADKIASGMALDVATSSEALQYYADYSIDSDKFPAYINEILYSGRTYSSLSYTERVFFMQYVGVREDTMLNCEEWGYSMPESVPIALVMQKMETSIENAYDLISYYGSENKAMEVADLYYRLSFKYNFMIESDQKNDMAKLVSTGVSPYVIPDIYAVAKHTNLSMLEAASVFDSAEIINNEVKANGLESRLDVYTGESNFEESIVNAVKTVNQSSISICDEKLQEITHVKYDGFSVDVRNAIAQVRQSGEIAQSVIAAMSADSSENSQFDSTLKTGAIDYTNCVNDSVDMSNGALRYNEQLFNIKGLNGLDFILNLSYSNNTLSACDIDDRFNMAQNWAFSFPYMSDSGGDKFEDSGETDFMMACFVTLPNGETYEIDKSKKNDKGEYSLKKGYDDIKVGMLKDGSAGKNARFYLRYSDGTIYYFDNKGRWISTVNRFGNMIHVYEDTRMENGESTIKIEDSLKQITEFHYNENTKIQTIILPNDYEIHINYQYKLNNKNTNEYIVSSITIGEETTKYEYEWMKGGGNKKNYGEVIEGDNEKNALLTKITYPSGLERYYEYNWERIYTMDVVVEGKSFSLQNYKDKYDRCAYEIYNAGAIDNMHNIYYVVVTDDYANAKICKQYYKLSAYDNKIKGLEEYIYYGSAGSIYDSPDTYVNTLAAFNIPSEYEYHAKCVRDAEQTIYDFDIYGRNVFKNVTNGDITKTTKLKYQGGSAYCKPIRVEHRINNVFQYEEEYSYTTTGKVIKATVKNGNTILSCIENSYSDEYDILTCTKIMKDSNETVVKENTLCTEIEMLKNKVIVDETTKIGSKIVTKTQYTYYTDSNGLLGRTKTIKKFKELNSNGSINVDKYIEYDYTYMNSSSNQGYTNDCEVELRDKGNEVDKNYTNKYVYDTIGRLELFTDGNNNCVQYMYDCHNNIIEKKLVKITIF